MRAGRGWAGVHVDDAGVGVGVELEEELARVVDDLVVAVDVLEFAGDLCCPVGQVLDIREIPEYLAARGRGRPRPQVSAWASIS